MDAERRLLRRRPTDRSVSSAKATGRVPQRVPVFAARDVEAAARVLLVLPGARRMWIFGSVAKGHRPCFRSDLGLAMEGLMAERQRPVWAFLDETLELQPDLVR